MFWYVHIYAWVSLVWHIFIIIFWSHKSLYRESSVGSDLINFFLFIWMNFTNGLKWYDSWKPRLEWRMTPWWQHYDTLPAGFDRVPPRHVTVLSCASNPSQHTHNSHTLYIPLRPSLTRHSSMPRRPIRRRLMRRSVTHLRMHDKVLLDFPVATVCSLHTPLNTHERTYTFACTHSTFLYVIEDACQRVLRQQ